MKRALCSAALLCLLGCGGDGDRVTPGRVGLIQLERPAIVPGSRWKQIGTKQDFDDWIVNVFATCDGTDKVYVLVGMGRGYIAVSSGACAGSQP